MNSEFRHFTEKEGLLMDFVNALCLVRSRLWLGFGMESDRNERIGGFGYLDCNSVKTTMCKGKAGSNPIALASPLGYTKRPNNKDMRINSYPFPLAVAVTLMGKLAASAQDWATVDDFALAGANAEAHGIAVDATCGIYVVGTANGHAIVRYSADGGSNWAVRDDFVYGTEPNNAFNAITIDPQGGLFVGGASGGHWIIRKSADQGATWGMVDDFYGPFRPPSDWGTNGSVYSLSSDSQGRVYAAGLMRRTGPNYNNWLVRGCGIGSTNWDTRLLLFSIYGQVAQISCAGEDIYVTGSTADGSGVSTGHILRSSDYGATWPTDFQTTNEVYYAIASDSAGNVFSAGNRWTYPEQTSVDWLVRKAAPGATTWTTLDHLSYQDTCGCGVSQPNPRSVAIDAAGNICVVGRFSNRWLIQGSNSTTYAGNETWFTRQFSAASGQWSTSDLFSYYPTNSPNWTNLHSVALGTAIAPDGSTFVAGYGTTESGQRRWVVRKQSAFVAPRLQIAMTGRSVAVSWPTAYTNSTLEWSDTMGGANQVWHAFDGTVSVVDGRKTATIQLAPGARSFRLKCSGSQ